MQNQQGRYAVTHKSRLNWHILRRHGLSPTVGGIVAIPLVSQCPPQAGQPSASKLLTRHSISASMGAWSSGRSPKNRLCTMHQANEEIKRNTQHCFSRIGTSEQCVLDPLKTYPYPIDDARKVPSSTMS